MRLRNRAPLLCVGALTLLLTLSPLTAAIMRPMSFDELVTQADYVARVRVTETSVRREGGRHISAHRLKLLALYDKAPDAPSPTSIILETLGGSYRDLQQRVSGSPQLERGEELIVLLRCVAQGGRPPALERAQHQGARCRLVGMGQGLWRPEIKPEGAQEPRWAPSLEGVRFLRAGELSESPLKPMPLSELLGAIRRARQLSPPTAEGVTAPSAEPLKAP